MSLLVWSFDGDMEKAKSHTGEALNLLYQLKHRKQTGKLDQISSPVYTMDDGTTIRISSVFDNDKVWIESPYVPKPGPEKEIKGFMPAYLVQGGWVIADWNTLEPMFFVETSKIIECQGAPWGGTLDMVITGGGPQPRDTMAALNYVDNEILYMKLGTDSAEMTYHQDGTCIPGNGMDYEEVTNWSNNGVGMSGSGIYCITRGDPSKPDAIKIPAYYCAKSHVSEAGHLSWNFIGSLSATNDDDYSYGTSYLTVVVNGASTPIFEPGTNTFNQLIVSHIKVNGAHEFILTTNWQQWHTDGWNMSPPIWNPQKIMKQQSDTHGIHYTNKALYAGRTGLCVSCKGVNEHSDILYDIVDTGRSHNIQTVLGYQETYLLCTGKTLNHIVQKSFLHNSFYGDILGYQSQDYLSLVYYA